MTWINIYYELNIVKRSEPKIYRQPLDISNELHKN